VTPDGKKVRECVYSGFDTILCTPKALDTYYTSLNSDKWRSKLLNMELASHNVVYNFTTALLYMVSLVTMARIVAMLLNIY